MTTPRRDAARAPLLLASALFAIVCSSGCIAGRVGPARPLPAGLGSHPVGVSSMDVHDAERDRDLTVEVWYPAAHVRSTASPTVYEIDAAGLTVARLRSAVGARRDVAPWRGDGPRPVVLLSHGAGSSRLANASLSEVLASHGYIVAAPDHPGHTVADKVWGISESERAKSAFDRPLDLSRVLDELLRRSRGSDPLLSGLVDEQRVGVAGHSFGGRAALGLVGARFDSRRQRAECDVDAADGRCPALGVFGAEAYRYRDPRIKAALLITPAGYEFYRHDGVAQVDAPVLVVGAEHDTTDPYDTYHRPTYDALTGPRYMLYLKGAGHLTATDVCEVVDSIGFLARAFGGERAQDGCGARFMSTSEALDRVSAASLPFFDRYLNGNQAAEGQLRAALGPVPGGDEPATTTASRSVAAAR